MNRRITPYAGRLLVHRRAFIVAIFCACPVIGVHGDATIVPFESSTAQTSQPPSPAPVGGQASVATGERSSQGPAARAAVEKILPLLQSSAQTWIDRVSCTSCHHQGLGTMAVSLARERGFAIDDNLLTLQLTAIRGAGRASYALLLQGEGGINGNFGRSYNLLALASAGRPRDDSTDAVAHFLMSMQSADGGWPSESYRPPLESSRVTTTAITARALSLFAPDGRADEARGRIDRAAQWLERIIPADNEDRVMRLLGLGWSKAGDDRVRAAAGDLLATQREDGGWAQLPTRSSDAYATGQALVALATFGGLPVTAAAYERGVAFLLQSREPDGTWMVETRRRGPGLPYFETGFPHDKNQFISYAASAWATMALTLAAEPGSSDSLNRPALPRDAHDNTARLLGVKPIHRAAAFGSADDLKRVLDDGATAEGGGPGGVTPLMLAVHDEAKVRMLLAAGASPKRASNIGYTAAHLAAGTAGAQSSLRALIEAGALATAVAPDGTDVAQRAARSSDIANLKAVEAAGVSIIRPAVNGISPLMYATFHDDVEMVRYLLDRGAPVDELVDGDEPLLQCAVMDGRIGAAEALLARGVRVNAVDGEGMTALAWAAKVDLGDLRVAKALIAAGADANLASKNGYTPLQWATEFGSQPMAELLRPITGSSKKP